MGFPMVNIQGECQLSPIGELIKYMEPCGSKRHQGVDDHQADGQSYPLVNIYILRKSTTLVKTRYFNGHFQ